MINDLLPRYFRQGKVARKLAKECREKVRKERSTLSERYVQRHVNATHSFAKPFISRPRVIYDAQRVRAERDVCVQFDSVVLRASRSLSSSSTPGARRSEHVGTRSWDKTVTRVDGYLDARNCGEMRVKHVERRWGMDGRPFVLQ